MKGTATSYEEVRSAALALKDEQRIQLAEELFDSVEADYDPELQALLDRRFEELVTGKVKGIPADESLARVEAHLESKRAANNRSS